jgi:ribose/xylose/arabinose/galactoside ABC-type transport system permease subunit
MLRKISYFGILILALVAVIVLMIAFNGIDFLSFRNLKSMAFQMPELGILTLAMMIAMLTSGINLSIIATANLSGIIMALILTKLFPAESALAGSIWVSILAILAGLAVGAIVGMLNGFLVAVVEISPILATLGTMIMLRGISVVITEGYVISGFPPAILAIGNKSLLGIPVPMIIFLICAGFMAVLLNRTPLGTRIYMIGSNPIACFYAGVNNRKVLFRTYIISGIYSGITALIMISRFNSAKADYGESYLLQTVLAAVLGGVSAAGGFGKVSGLFVSLVIMQMISSGLNLIGVSNFLTIALWGIILIVVMVGKYFMERGKLKWIST